MTHILAVGKPMSNPIKRVTMTYFPTTDWKLVSEGESFLLDLDIALLVFNPKLANPWGQSKSLDKLLDSPHHFPIEAHRIDGAA